MSPPTRVDAAYGQIRRAILNGEYEPGAKLNSVQLQDRFGLSTGVLREVLSRLTGDGFVTAQPQRGFRLITISRGSVEELTEALIVVETTLIEQAVASGDLDYEAGLTAAHHRLANTPHDDETGHTGDAWRAVHSAFHRQLLDGARNQRLKAIAFALRDQSEIYRSWSVSVAKDVDRDVAAEHLELMEAVLARDVVGAALAIRNHAERSRDALLAVTRAPDSQISKSPDATTDDY